MREKKISVMGLGETNMKREGYRKERDLGCQWRGWNGLVYQHNNRGEE